ncbi:MAG TPA: methyltransferase domain-containing protein [Candidatus Methylomirabilis sp.]|jgi:SAM-dependent methyltransferase|nr:methyltransferase domain-containing protein [Candidatus Methylomirabilis sp.]
MGTEEQVEWAEVDLGGICKPFPHLLQHRVLLEDGPRVAALAAAIQAAVRPGDVVLEVGSGTGVLAVLAARAGARRIYAVERTALAAVAAAVARENGVGSRVRVVEGDARAIRFPERADLLITETIGHLGLEEGLGAIVRGARRRHLKPGGRVLPRRLRILVAPVALPAFSREVLTPWRRLVGAAGRGTPHACRRIYKIRWDDESCLAPPAVIWDLDLGGRVGPPPRVAGAVTFHGLRRGPLAGFVVTFEAELVPGLVLSSRQGTTWRPAFLPLPCARRVGRATTVRLHLALREQGPGCRVTWSGVIRTPRSRRPFRCAAGPRG